MCEIVVKWAGSKRKQAGEIVSFFPDDIDVYYEPFCGGCSVLRRLLESPRIKVRKYECSDLNGDLIALWNKIKSDPLALSCHYEILWNELNIDEDLNRKKDYFASVRERYNRERRPEDFLFILRTTVNGMPRYNHDGDFNNSFHITRKGIVPSTMHENLFCWSDLLNKKHVTFTQRSYDAITDIGSNDLLYLDPPYANTKGMYFGNFDVEALVKWVGGVSKKAKVVMSFDGKAGSSDMTYDIPDGIFVRHLYLDNGNSSFRRVLGKNLGCNVKESIYLNYEAQGAIVQEEFGL